ncbi:MAG: SBBP repeat-containing protein [Candidatus Aminicenantes bacterium]|nr:SBBP repeat-containing protein [Candidatus Aminicenantes bacterium]
MKSLRSILPVFVLMTLIFAPAWGPAASSAGCPETSGAVAALVSVLQSDLRDQPPVNRTDLIQHRSGGHALGFGPGSVIVAARTHILTVEFPGATDVRPLPGDSVPGGFSIVYRNLWPGVTLKYEGVAGGIVKSTYELAPGADLKSIRLRTNVPLRDGGNGRLAYGFDSGEMVESAPVAWQEIDGRRVEVETVYRIESGRQYGFQAGDYDSDLPLIIDPVLTWNTFLGRAESTEDEARAVATDGSSVIVVCGTSDGPWGSPVRDFAGGASDAYVAKFNASGVRQWVSFLGGADADLGRGVVLDASGNVFVTGTSAATWGSPRRAFGSGRDAFAAKLNPSGVLQWNTFLGGNAADEGRGIVPDGSGSFYVAGSSEASWGSPKRAYGSGRDAFAAKLNSSGDLQWNTFLGGSSTDEGTDIAWSVVLGGRVFVAGNSGGTWGSPVIGYAGSQDGFAAALNTSGDYQWHSFVGGTGSDSAEGIAVTATGAVFLTGTSHASWGGSPIRAFSTGPDPYAAMLHPGGVLNWNTFLGGTGADSGADIALDGGGNVYVTGTAESSWGSPVQSYRGQKDGFAAKLTSLGALTWNSFFGSAGDEDAFGLIVLISGGCAVVGKSDTGPWPSGNPAAAYAGEDDGFLEILSASGGHSAYAFMGGLGFDEGNAVGVDAAGNVYVAGTSRKTWGSPLRAFTGSESDVFVAKLNAAGARQWMTFLGGAAEDRAAGIAVTPAGIVHVMGQSAGTWGVPKRGYGGGAQDAFAAKLNADGSLAWNTFLGGSGGDFGYGITVDGSGNTYIAGFSPTSWGTPTRAYSGSNDAFAAKLSSAGVLVWNAFLGGNGSDIGNGIAVDDAGGVYVAGTSAAAWGSPIRGFVSSTDGFAAEFNAEGGLQWHTFLGGSNSDSAAGVAVFGTDTVYVTGQSRSTWGAPLVPHPGFWNGYAAELNGSGALQWNTFFGTSSVLVDPRSADADILGNLYIGGLSSGSWGAPFRAHSGNDDAFAAMFDSAGTLVWNGFFGSSEAEIYGGLSAAGTGDVYLAGSGTKAWGSPVADYGGGTDAFALRIANELPPTIALNSPNGGETWGQGTVQSIAWTATGAWAGVKIDYSTNGGSSWSSIAASAPNTGTYAWTLPMVVSVNCLVRVGAAGGGLPIDQSDAVFTITDQIPTIALSRASFSFGAERYGAPTPAQTTILSNSGTGTLNWTAAPQVDWISVTPASGTGNAVLTVSINRTDHEPGAYQGTIMVSAGGASNTPRAITIDLNIAAEGADAPPFGGFDTPTDGATVRSSIAVTGWALDDVHVGSVKIYRGTGLSDRIFIGDATLVAGARPDVEAAFPGNPENDRAGWGYMLLTNFLPDGDGPYSLLAYAQDSKGQETLLGVRTIVVDNASAVQPFGAIDTPAQGGTASGSGYFNFGWALTPLPDVIPADGSTILVWVDGQPLGHPDYDHYRADIATLFPGYLNSNGAVGFYILDTEALADGVHTIAWSVVDSNGEVDGIGSRYFMVDNLAPAAVSEGLRSEVDGAGDNPNNARGHSRVPVFIRRGFDPEVPVETVIPDDEGRVRFIVPVLSRLEIHLRAETASEPTRRLKMHVAAGHEAGDGSRYEAFQVVGGERRPLPIGASFDAREGILYWQPGPGFVGEFEIIVAGKDFPGAGWIALRITVVSPGFPPGA